MRAECPGVGVGQGREGAGANPGSPKVGSVNPNWEMKLERETAAIATVDCDNGLGLCGGRRAGSRGDARKRRRGPVGAPALRLSLGGTPRRRCFVTITAKFPP